MTSVRAELRKLRFTRSLWALPAIAALASVVGSALLIAFLDEREVAARLSEHGPLRFGPTNVGLVLLVFGIRMFADETHHDTLASTYLAVPSRRRVLAAKATVTAAVALSFSIIVFVLVVPITIVGVEARELPMSTDLASTAGLLARTSVAMTMLALLGVVLGAIIRNRAVALVACLAWLALGENLVGSLFKVAKVLPGSAVRALVDGSGSHDLLDPIAAACALAALTAIGATVAIARLSQDVT
jgi:hypothetical protein